MRNADEVYNSETNLTAIGSNVIKADSACPSCSGVGYVKAESGPYQKCGCIVKQEALAYLTPVYADATWTKTFDAAMAEKHLRLRFEGAQTVFKGAVKSFLLNSGMKYSHRTVTAHDVLQAYLTDSETRDFYKLKTTDFLVLYLVSDPPNKSYGKIMTSLIESRLLTKKITWVYSIHPTNLNAFGEAYQSDFGKYLSETFALFKATK